MNFNLPVYLIECIVLVLGFTAAIIIPLMKDPVWWIHDFPEDIQEKYFETHERIPTRVLSPAVLLKKSAALVLAFGVLTGLTALAGAKGFCSGFLLSYGLWSVINWYDCFFLDWVLFANLKAVRLPGTEHMDAAYHQKTYHFIRALYGAALGLIPCLLCGALLALL